MAGECYKMILADHKPRADWQMPAIAIFGAALLLALGGVIFAIGRSQYLYNRFKVDWVHTIVYAEHHNSFVVLEGERPCPPRDSYEDALSVLFWPGRPVKAPKDPPGMTVTYGDGSSSRYWETTFADYSGGRGAERKPGVILAFTNAAGKTYCVETDNDYCLLRAWLRGEIRDYYALSQEEWELVEDARQRAP